MIYSPLRRWVFCWLAENTMKYWCRRKRSGSQGPTNIKCPSRELEAAWKSLLWDVDSCVPKLIQHTLFGHSGPGKGEKLWHFVRFPPHISNWRSTIGVIWRKSNFMKSLPTPTLPMFSRGTQAGTRVRNARPKMDMEEQKGSFPLRWTQAYCRAAPLFDQAVFS